MVHAVGEVNVDAPAGLEHGGVARCASPEGVGARVLLAAVGLHLGQADRDAPGRVGNGDDGAQQRRGRLQTVTSEQ